MAINIARTARRERAVETDRLRLARFLADLLDQRFTIPGTSIRIGLDPIVSLIPGVGDLLANLTGSFIIFGTAFGLIFRESTALDRAQRACFDAGATICRPSPAAFMRYAIYAGIGLVEVIALFLASLEAERRLRERDYAPEWRR